MYERSTKRLILDALAKLLDGFDVVVVAHPAAFAFELAESVTEAAKHLGIAAEMRDDNGDERIDDTPLVFTRPFGWTPPFGTKLRPAPVVLVDQSAVFERPRTVSPQLRTTITARLKMLREGVGTVECR